MDISTETIDHLAHLARLEFKGAEKAGIKADLEKIIGFMDKLREIDTKDVELKLQRKGAWWLSWQRPLWSLLEGYRARRTHTKETSSRRTML